MERDIVVACFQILRKDHFVFGERGLLNQVVAQLYGLPLDAGIGSQVDGHLLGVARIVGLELEAQAVALPLFQVNGRGDEPVVATCHAVLVVVVIGGVHGGLAFPGVIVVIGVDDAPQGKLVVGGEITEIGYAQRRAQHQFVGCDDRAFALGGDCLYLVGIVVTRVDGIVGVLGGRYGFGNHVVPGLAGNLIGQRRGIYPAAVYARLGGLPANPGTGIVEPGHDRLGGGRRQVATHEYRLGGSEAVAQAVDGREAVNLETLFGDLGIGPTLFLPDNRVVDGVNELVVAIDFQARKFGQTASAKSRGRVGPAQLGRQGALFAGCYGQIGYLGGRIGVGLFEGNIETYHLGIVTQPADLLGGTGVGVDSAPEVVAGPVEQVGLVVELHRL